MIVFCVGEPGARLINLNYLIRVVVLDERGSDGGHAHPLGQIGDVGAVKVLFRGTKVNVVQQQTVEVKGQGGECSG